MPYVDLHVHLGTKAVLAVPSEQNDCWKKYRVPDGIVEHIFDSQSALSQFVGQGDWRLICCALHPPEREALSYCGFRLFARLGRDYTVARMDHLRTMPYHAILQEEMQLIMRSLVTAKPGLTPKHIRSMAEYDPTPGILNVLFTVEGSHSFFEANADGTEPIEQILARLRAFADAYAPVAINLCHFQTHALAAQAFAFIFRTYKADHKGLFPSGTGISPSGHRFIETCHEKGILVDLKHLGLSARHDFYKTYTGVPLLATHMGLTGIRSTDHLPIKTRTLYVGRSMRVIYRKPKGHLSGTYFNPTSINLYDDDIETILRSSGLIALSLDQRILGASEPMFILDHVKKKEREFVSLEDMELFGGPWKSTKAASAIADPMVVVRSEGSRDVDDDVEVDEEMLREQTAYLKKQKSLRGVASDAVAHRRFLANQIVHIARVARAAGLPWKEHISIGSDMDGLINTLDHCTNVERYARLEEGLRTSLKSSSVKAAIGEAYDADDLTDRIMHSNAIDFFRRNAFGGWKTPA